MGVGEGVDLVKNSKTISDHFSVWNNFDFFHLTIHFSPQLCEGEGVGGFQKCKSYFGQF